MGGEIKATSVSSPVLQRSTSPSTRIPSAAPVRTDTEFWPLFLPEDFQRCKQEPHSRILPPTLRTTSQPGRTEENSELISVTPGTQAKHIPKGLGPQMGPSGNKKMENPRSQSCAVRQVSVHRRDCGHQSSWIPN